MTFNKKDKKTKPQVMRLNRWLSNKYAVIAICALQDLLIFLLLQYVMNLIMNVPAWLQDLDHPERYISVHNMLPNMRRVSMYPWMIVFYVVVATLCIVVDVITVYRIHTALADSNFNVGQKGVARWTTNKEIKQQYKEIPDRDMSFPGAGGTIVSRIGTKLYIDQSSTNNLIIGITRSGKGEMFVVPSIDVYSRAEEKTSMVVTDPKMELYKMSKKTLENRGYDVFLLNLDDPLHSMGFNPLEQIKEEYMSGHYAEAELLAQSFSFSIFNPNSPANTDAFWQDTASSLLTALILAHIEDCVKEDGAANARRYRAYKQKQVEWQLLDEQGKTKQREVYEKLKAETGLDVFLDHRLKAIPEDVEFFYTHENEKKINMYSIINTFTELARIQNEDNPNLTALDSYFSERPALNRAKLKYAGIEVAGDRTKGSIFASMMVKLTIFTFENIAKMTAESSLKLEDVGYGQKPIAAFLAIPDYDKSSHFLATVFIRQLTFVLEKRATRNKTGKCDRRVKFICDEFGNLPAIEGMESTITVCLGRNISFDLYIQAYAQVQKLYGDDSETIIGNCGNQIFILTNDDNTSKNFSENLGNETIVDIQRSGDKMAMKKHFTESMIEKPLLNKNELEELKPGECVVKRVMKRQDLKGRSIRPTPIFNSVKSGKRFLYRYEYLTDTFPNPDTIDLQEVNTEDRSFINHVDRVWDYQLSFKQIVEEQKKTKESVQILSSMENKKQIRDVLQKCLDAQEYEAITDDMHINEIMETVKCSSMKDNDKRSVLAFLELSAG